MRVAALEVPARWGAPDAQLEWVRGALDGCAADLIVLPEACLTGYVSPRGDWDPTALAEEIVGGPTTRAVAAIARERSAHVAFPLIERDAGAIYNACVVVAPNGAVIARYRKRHPWYPETWATPGREPFAAIELGGARVVIAICFDVHFLEDEAAEALGGADALVFPSAWFDDEPDVDARGAIFARLVRRFGITIVNANWGPGDVRVPGQGASRVVGPGFDDRPGPRAWVARTLRSRAG